MGEWGLRRLAEALRPFVNEEDAEAALAGYWPLVEAEWLSTFRKKLGLLVTEEEGDEELLRCAAAASTNTGGRLGPVRLPDVALRERRPRAALRRL